MQAIQHDRDLLLSRILLARLASDIPHRLFGAVSCIHRFLSTGSHAIEEPLSGTPVPPQSVDATHALNLSAGVSNSSVFRGRSLS